MGMAKRTALVIAGICMINTAFGSDQGGWLSGWTKSLFQQPAQMQTKRFIYRGRTPQDVAYEDLVAQYGCDSNDPKALCNIQIPEIELSKSNGPAYEGFVEKRTTAKKPVAYRVKVHKQEPTLRSYLRGIYVPRVWAGGTREEPSAMTHISRMKDPELEEMLQGYPAVGTENNYDALVKGVQEKMEEQVVNNAYDDVIRNQNNLFKAYFAAEDKEDYAQQALEECSLKNTRSPELCGGQKMYLDDIKKRRAQLYQELEPEKHALEDAIVQLAVRKNKLREQKFARRRAASKLEEDRKWQEWLLKQEIGE